MRGVAVGAHCLELLVVFGTRVDTHLVASGSQLIDLSIPFLDLRFHRREVFIFLAHGETPLLVCRQRAGTDRNGEDRSTAVSITLSGNLPSMQYSRPRMSYGSEDQTPNRICCLD